MTIAAAAGAERVDRSEEDRWTPRTIAVLMACGMGNIVGATAVINCTFFAFLLPVTSDLGWQRWQFSLVLTIVSVVGLAAYPAAGRLMDRFGARPVVLAGNILFGLSLMLLSFMPADLATAYLLFALLGVTAAMPSTVLLARVASSWFHEKRGLALGLSTGAAIGIGGTVMPVTTQMMIESYGWRGAYLGQGALVVLLGFPFMFAFLREAPFFRRATLPGAIPLAGIGAADALRSRPFWMLITAVSLGAGSLTAVVTHVSAILLENGITPVVAAWTIAAMSITNATWQIALGRVLDRSALPRRAAPFVVIAVLGVCLVCFGTRPWMIVTGGALMGIGSGTDYGLLPYCMPRYFGFRSYGVLYGWIFSATMLVTGLTPFLMDVIRLLTGSYSLVVMLVNIALLLSAWLIYRLEPYRFAVSDGEGSGLKRASG